MFDNLFKNIFKNHMSLTLETASIKVSSIN